MLEVILLITLMQPKGIVDFFNLLYRAIAKQLKEQKMAILDFQNLTRLL